MTINGLWRYIKVQSKYVTTAAELRATPRERIAHQKSGLFDTARYAKTDNIINTKKNGAFWTYGQKAKVKRVD